MRQPSAGGRSAARARALARVLRRGRCSRRWPERLLRHCAASATLPRCAACRRWVRSCSQRRRCAARLRSGARMQRRCAGGPVACAVPGHQASACRPAGAHGLFRGSSCDVDQPEAVRHLCMLHSISSKLKYDNEPHQRRLGACACARAAGVAGGGGLAGSARSAAARALRTGRGSDALRRNT